MSKHLYAVGEHVSYAENGTAGPWTGGYAIVALLPGGTQGHNIRSAMPGRSYDRVVREHELAEDWRERMRVTPNVLRHLLRRRSKV